MASPSAEREEAEAEEEDLPSARSVEQPSAASVRPDREPPKTQAQGPYRAPGVRDEGPVVETPKDRTAAMVGFAALGGIALLVVVRGIATVPVVRPPEPEGAPVSVAALSPTPAEVIIAAPAPSMMVQSRAEEVSLSMASERNEYGAVRAMLLPKVATLDCIRLRTLRQACYATKDSKCLSKVAPRLAVLSCPTTGL